MSVRGKLFVISGASGSGKSTAMFTALSSSLAGELKLKSATKYSERARRENDPYDDIFHVPSISSVDFDFTYLLNETVYAIKTEEVEADLRRGFNLLVILSDLRTVARLKKRFPSELISIYVSSAIDPSKLNRIQQTRRGFSLDDGQRDLLRESFFRLESGARLGMWERVYNDALTFSDTWRQFIPDALSTKIRQERIRDFHTRYIDNIALFDHVILNYREGGADDMGQQLLNIIRRYNVHSRKAVPRPPIFVICAASGMGKGTLMEKVALIGGGSIRVATKAAGRDPKANDKRDGMIAIGKGVPLPSCYDIRWTFHGGTVPYGISSDAIRKVMESGVAQIFTSNMGQIDQLREAFGSNVVFIYLHRTISRSDMEQYQMKLHVADPEQASIRVNEIESVYKNYISKIGEFDHVLLNTGYEEDLFNQMLQLIDAHSL